MPSVSQPPTAECSLCQQVARVWRFDEDIEAFTEGGILVSSSAICADCLRLVFRFAIHEE